nr:PREDICTED: uncharacterized protein LOC102358603 [Latimeria chalumnae]|eukprot:XP_005999399.1 PREDICTED: uncharacterized protein LOC102358603 [Latimeria chalumnae]
MTPSFSSENYSNEKSSLLQISNHHEIINECPPSPTSSFLLDSYSNEKELLPQVLDYYGEDTGCPRSPISSASTNSISNKRELLSHAGNAQSPITPANKELRSEVRDEVISEVTIADQPNNNLIQCPKSKYEIFNYYGEDNACLRSPCLSVSPKNNSNEKVSLCYSSSASLPGEVQVQAIEHAEEESRKNIYSPWPSTSGDSVWPDERNFSRLTASPQLPLTDKCNDIQCEGKTHEFRLSTSPTLRETGENEENIEGSPFKLSSTMMDERKSADTKQSKSNSILYFTCVTGPNGDILKYGSDEIPPLVSPEPILFEMSYQYDDSPSELETTYTREEDFDSLSVSTQSEQTPEQEPELEAQPNPEEFSEEQVVNPPDWMRFRQSGFKCIACCRIFNSLEALQLHARFGRKEGFSCRVFYRKFKAMWERDNKKELQESPSTSEKTSESKAPSRKRKGDEDHSSPRPKKPAFYHAYTI